MDYNPTRVLRRRNVLATVPAKDVPTTMVLTLHDDSVGVLPLIATGSLHELVGDMRRVGISGFGTRQWLISDHDASLAYLSKAAWDPDATPKAVSADQVRAVCGEAAVGPMLEVLPRDRGRDRGLEDHGMGLSFSRAGHDDEALGPRERFRENSPTIASIYRRALAAVRKVPESRRAEGREYVGIGRAGWSSPWATSTRSRRSRRPPPRKRPPGTPNRKATRWNFARRLSEAAERTKAAQTAAFQAIEAFAGVARNQADRGAIATMAEYVDRPLKRKAEELRAECAKSEK